MKDVLRRYLQAGRDALLWKLDSLSEYDMRRPVVPTGTNLLGLLRHAANVETGYLGLVFGRPFPERDQWPDDGNNVDKWIRAHEKSADVIAYVHRQWAHADATIDALELDAVGEVPWWPEDRRAITLHTALVHLIFEVNRHAGHADVIREIIDGKAGLTRAFSNLSDLDEPGWAAYYEKVERAAREATP